MTGEGKDEITLEGFLGLHVMTAEDEEGGEEELWEVLSTLGYSRQLQLDQVPFQHCLRFLLYAAETWHSVQTSSSWLR